MAVKKVITPDQAMEAMRNGEFGSDVTGSAKLVVVVMTQDWCPQWADMKRWIYGIDANGGLQIYELIYDLETYFNDFRNFKERTWNNDRIPYLRYYRDGSLYLETNYVSRRDFASAIG